MSTKVLENLWPLLQCNVLDNIYNSKKENPAVYGLAHRACDVKH